VAVSGTRRTAQSHQGPRTDNAAGLKRALPAPHLFTVDEYYRMAEAGILTEESRVELIDGVIIDMPPIGPEHAGSVDGLGDLLRASFGGRVIVRSQNPVHLGLRSEPEPDFALLRRRDDYYRKVHPLPDDIYLLIEVSDSTLRHDLKTKASLYARAGIQEYWIVDLIHRVIVVHRDPSRSRYRSVQQIQPGDTVAPLAFPDVPLAVSDLLG
jgi:Uma2 family endonuclease